MVSLMTTFALLLLAAPGVALLLLITPAGTPHRIPLVAGYGLLSGLVGVPLMMRLLDSAGVSLAFAVSGSSVLLLTCVLLLLAYRGGRVGRTTVSGRSGVPSLSRPELVFSTFLLLLISVRLAVLAAEVVWRPLFPWDATMHWATKARVWLEYLDLRPFIDNADWLRTAVPEVYTDHHPGYPITIPLLQLWMTSALGYWNESLMNLPWVLCFVGLGAAFYAQARQAGATAVVAMAFTYFLLSMPLLNTHVALAGYADLLLGACYCLAIMALHSWSVSRDRAQALLAVIFAMSCALIKNEGTFWLLTFVPACLVVILPGRRSLYLLLALSMITVVGLLLFPRDLVVAGHSLEELRIFYRPAALQGVFDSFFVHDSWHLFAYLLSGLLILGLLFRRSAFYESRAVGVALAAAVFLFLFLFLFTAYSGGAIRLTAVSRIGLQLVPAAMFYCLLLSRAIMAAPPQRP